ncbi:acylphosphatase [Candidatus Uhrbacteria bacterium]|nr:acylphosphatase [Candidatus Uhrbacteria bacterium]
MQLLAVRIRITGRVQGVGFRNALYERAVGLDVRGFVRNRADGTIEAHAVGSQQAIDELVAWCHKGPPMASVTDISVEPLEDTPVYSAFVHL